jgi:hypothetical protein
MTAFNIDSFSTYGGPFANYGAGVVDPTTDMDASQGNKFLAAAAGMTHTCPRAWVSMTVDGTATPTLVAHDAIWGSSIAVQPTLAYSGSTGIFTVTWPATVSDEIPVGAAGYTGPLPLNLRAGWANLRVVSTPYLLFVTVSSANVATLSIYNLAGSLANPGVTTGIDIIVL